MKVCIFTDPEATENRTHRTKSIVKYFEERDCTVSEIDFKPRHLRQFFRATHDRKVIIAQIAPRRNVLAAALIWRPRIVFELRDPLCDWSYHKGRARKVIDVLLLLIAYARGSAFVVRSGLQLTKIESKILKRKLFRAPEFGICTPLIERLEKEKTSRYSAVYCGNIYDDFYIDALNTLSEKLSLPLEWAGQFMYKSNRALDGTIYRHGVIAKEEAVKHQLAARSVVLINSAGPDYIPSKFTELLCLGIPIIYIAKEVDRISRLITTLEIGFVLILNEKEKIETGIIEVLGHFSEKKVRRVSKLARRLFSDARYHKRLADIALST